MSSKSQEQQKELKKAQKEAAKAKKKAAGGDAGAAAGGAPAPVATAKPGPTEATVQFCPAAPPVVAYATCSLTSTSMPFVLGEVSHEFCRIIHNFVVCVLQHTSLELVLVACPPRPRLCPYPSEEHLDLAYVFPTFVVCCVDFSGSHAVPATSGWEEHLRRSGDRTLRRAFVVHGSRSARRGRPGGGRGRGPVA